MCDDALLEDGGAGNNWVTRFSIFRHNIRSVFCRVVRVFSEAGRTNIQHVLGLPVVVVVQLASYLQLFHQAHEDDSVAYVSSVHS